MQWIGVGVNLSCTDVYAVLEWANDMKLQVFAIKHKTNTYHKHLIWIWWLCPDLELTPLKFMTSHEIQEYR